MKISRLFKSVSVGQRYALGWRVIGMIFSMYVALIALFHGLTWIGEAVGRNSWQPNDLVAVWIFMAVFLAIAPPVASLFLGLFFPLDRLAKHGE